MAWAAVATGVGSIGAAALNKGGAAAAPPSGSQAGGLSGAGIFSNYAPILGPDSKAEYDASGQSVAPKNTPTSLAAGGYSTGQPEGGGISSTTWILIGFGVLSVLTLGVMVLKRK